MYDGTFLYKVATETIPTQDDKNIKISQAYKLLKFKDLSFTIM